MLAVVSYASACTNFIVGKKASADGSVMCTYNADDYGMFIGLCHFPAGKHAKGEMRKIVDWDTHKYLGEIPEASETYNVIGNINELPLARPPMEAARRWWILPVLSITVLSSTLLCNAQRLRERPSR